MRESELSTLELKSEQKRVFKGSMTAVAVGSLVLGLSCFYPVSSVGDSSDLRSHLTFWAAANLATIFFVVLGIGMVSRGRRHSAHDICGSAYSTPSPKIAVAVAFLQNTVEQTFVFMFTQLAVLLLVGGRMKSFILASVFLFAVGRIAFLLGYPHGAGARSFGMALTAVPSLFAFILSLVTVIAWVWR